MFSWCEAILAVITIVFALVWVPASKWILFAVGVILLIHSISCKYCKTMCFKESPKKPMSKKR